MKVVHLKINNGKITVENYLVKVGDKIDRSNKWIVKSFTNNLHKIPEHVKMSGSVILATSLNNDFVTKYKIYQLYTLKENDSVKFYIKGLEKESKEHRRSIYKFVVKVLINLFEKQPISVTASEMEMIEKTTKKRFNVHTIIIIDDRFLMPNKYAKREEKQCM